MKQMLNTFCRIESDQKTFDYLSQYLDFLSELIYDKNYIKNGNPFLLLDNKIQEFEIQQHLNNHGMDCNQTNIANNEIISWINQNGKPFRSYISSIKMLAIMAFSKGILKGEMLNQDMFQKLCDIYNQLKDKILNHL